MDETEFRLGVAGRAAVLCKHLVKTRSGKVASDTNREVITAVHATSANGIVLPPLVIHPGVVH